MEEAANCGNDLESRAAALNAGGDKDEADALAFIMQVKEEVERCLAAGMSKEQMFRELREKGSHPAATYAVYKELRHQNKDFFKEYYVKMDVRKQAERLKLLVRQYRTVRDSGVRPRAPGTETQQTAMVIPPDDMGLLELNGDPQSAATSAQLPTGQPLQQREQPVPNGGNQRVLVPSAACTTSDGAMAVSYPWACTDNVGTMGWQGEQAVPLQHWLPGAGGWVLPPQGSYWPPPSSGERLPENGSHHAGAAPRHSQQAEPSWRPGTQPRSQLDSLQSYGNFLAHVTSWHGEQA
ncbi:hypothetical protein QYE76_045398 [Lolium multiflorum]|uniref:Uncharacterized protein n=1 Tax=Lolium multiflorum TaxID=4521 RepID=A0AAD8TKY8_LOLMU|nr:hypothetical protein QYE76_045398 [Lolium multiflorum]